MIFANKKIKKIFLNWVVEVAEFYKELLKPIVLENNNISESDYKNIYKKCINQYFEKATNLINNSNNSKVVLRWNTLPLSPSICGFDVDYENLSIGTIYAMTYYCFTEKEASVKDCTELNFINQKAFNDILIQLSNNLRRIK